MGGKYMEKSVHVSMLLEIYGKLITEKQRDIIDLYYNDNLSLSEIAEELGITRQGVHKNLVDAENKLFDYEEKLTVLKNTLERQEIIDSVISREKDQKIIEELKKCY